MTDRQRYILISDRVRFNALNAVRNAPENWTVTVAPATRSLDQNARMWAMLTDVSRAKPEGRQWPPETWKAAFLHYLGHQVMFAEGLDDSGPFPLGFRSSKLSVRQMADLITCIDEYGTRHGVIWTEPERCGLDQANHMRRAS